MLLLFKTPRILYHYTSIESLIKIFNPSDDSVSLRFTNISHLNDPLEQRYYLQQIDYPMAEFEHMMTTEPFFVFSLSSLKDNLEMWRLYAKDASGVAIGFRDLDILRPATDYSVFSYPIQLIPCCYGTRMIDKYTDIISMLGPDFHFNLSCIFKHNCYKHEKEFRLVSRCKYLYDKKYAIQKFPRSFVNEVWLGPKNCLTKEEVRRIIGDAITIRESDLPYTDPR